MTILSNLGKIVLSNDVIACVAGQVASSCFGVRGMADRNVTDGIVRLLRRDRLSQGVSIREALDGSVDITLHIIVNFGVNIQTACRSIISEVHYHTERLTGIPVGRVDVVVDSIRAN